MHPPTYLELLAEAAANVSALSELGCTESTVTADVVEGYGTYVSDGPNESRGHYAVQTATYVHTADHAMLLGRAA